MHAMVFGPADAKKADKLARWARKNPVPVAQMKLRYQLMQATGKYEIGDHCCMDIAEGYKIAYEHEEWPDHFGDVHVVRHLVVAGPNLMPHPRAIAFLMQVFDFVNLDLRKCMVVTSEIGEGRMAVNVMEPLDGDTNRFRPHKVQEANGNDYLFGGDAEKPAPPKETLQ